MAEGAEPRADRPVAPGYGIPDDEGLLPWSWASRLLEEALVYWVASVRPDGRPHLMPTWGAWVDDRLYLEGGRRTRRARNIAANPMVAVSVERGDEVVIVEGEALDVAPPDEDLAARVLTGFAKYRESKGYEADPANWDLPEGGLWEVRPGVAFGWGRFPTDATRWRFE